MAKKPTFDDMDSFVKNKKIATKSVPAKKSVKPKQTQKKAGRPKVNIYPTETKLTVSLPKDIHKNLKLKAVEMERPMAEVIVTALKQYLKI